MKLVVSLLAWTTLCLGGFSTVFAVDYPPQQGNVYDGAGMLSESSEIALEEKLLDFETATTIGIAVATVESLQGVDANTYAITLGKQWNIGSADSDNGVIVLVARKERELALWFGDGYEKAWSTRTSQRIRDNVMVPQLKAGKPELAATKGVDEVIRQVTAAGYVNKWSGGAGGTASQQAPSQNFTPPAGRAEGPRPRRIFNPKAALSTFGGTIAALAVLLIVIMQSRRAARRRELQTEIDQLTESLTHKLEQLPAMEEKLRASYPESMWGPALSAINSSAVERLLYTDTKRHSNAELTRQRDELRIAGGSVERVTELLRRAERGKFDAPRILRELPSQLEAIRAALQNPDVLPETAALLAPLEVRLGELQSQLPATDTTQIDWASFGDSVDKLVADAAQLRSRIDSDIAQVKRARESVPQLMQDAQAKLASLRELNNGRYGDVDNSLNEMENLLRGYYGAGNYNAMNSRDIVYMLQALNNALVHAQTAETTYVTHTQPRSSGSSFGGGGGGSNSWGGGSSGGSSFGGSGGGGGGSSKW